jgi:CubicO group peptidase (beta-lactamase class C family)
MRFIGTVKMAGVLALALLTGAVASSEVPAVAPLASAATVLPARPLTKPDVDAWLDGFMPYALERGRAAGAVVVVVKDGKPLTERGFGFADVAKRARSIRRRRFSSRHRCQRR